jgi:hypothetical protein
MSYFELKMIYLILAAFLLTAFSGEKLNCCQCEEVLIFPQAAPVQFWLTGCDTYNETIPKGVHYKCFCQPWKCPDVIQIPFRDTFDESEVVGTPNIVGITLPDLDEWHSLNISSDLYDWTEGVSPTINLPTPVFPEAFSESEYLHAEYAFEDGKEYSVTINYTAVFNAGLPVTRKPTIVIMDDDFNVLFVSAFTSNSTATGANSKTFSFTANAVTSRIGFRHVVTEDTDITITSVSATRTDYEFTYPDPNNYELVIYDEDDIEIDRVSVDAILIPEGFFYYHTADVDLSELGVCDQQIRFEVEDLTASPDIVVAKSDCQNVTSSDYDPTVLIEYSSLKNFNGLVFEGVSPDPTYNIRIPAVFFHEDFPQTDEVAKLSSKVIKLNSQTEAKRRLDIDFLPYYMHLKIQLILSMPLVLIEELYWTKQDSYEKSDGSKRWPVKSASVWLTQRDFLERQSL